MSSVAILGCGPAALLAAHEISMSNPETRIEIYSKKTKSPIHGAQYLHEPIEGIIGIPREIISYKIVGGTVPYLQKVYGPEWDGSIKDEMRESRHYAWDIRECYDFLWGKFERMINDVWFDHAIFRDFYNTAENGRWDFVINTLPKPILCSNNHWFKGTEIYAAGDAPSEGIECPVDCPPGDVIYNGREDVGWYRVSNIFGHRTAEWPARKGMKKPPIDGVVKVKKPLSHNCDCWPLLKNIGRFGQWQNGVLAHHAIRQTQDIMLNGNTQPIQHV